MLASKLTSVFLFCLTFSLIVENVNGGMCGSDDDGCDPGSWWSWLCGRKNREELMPEIKKRPEKEESTETKTSTTKSPQTQIESNSKNPALLKNVPKVQPSEIRFTLGSSKPSTSKSQVPIAWQKPPLSPLKSKSPTMQRASMSNSPTSLPVRKTSNMNPTLCTNGCTMSPVSSPIRKNSNMAPIIQRAPPVSNTLASSPFRQTSNMVPTSQKPSNYVSQPSPQKMPSNPNTSANSPLGPRTSHSNKQNQHIPSTYDLESEISNFYSHMYGSGLNDWSSSLYDLDDDGSSSNTNFMMEGLSNPFEQHKSAFTKKFKEPEKSSLPSSPQSPLRQTQDQIYMQIIEKNFKKAVNDAGSLKRMPSGKDLEDMYALYQQAALGDCYQQRPTDPEAITFWNAWKRKQGTHPIKAKEEFIYKVRKLIGKIGLN